jgi:uracil-DNA glycosylase
MAEDPTSDNVATAPDIGGGWEMPLAEAFQAPGFAGLKRFLVEERRTHTIYPKGGHIFNAFQNTPFHEVNVVILGQDPYHGPGQAHGLAFSVPGGMAVPPSLQNIFQELHRDLGLPIPTSGDLSPWARQGVLLLNATLTVRAASAGSHQGRGWEAITDLAIQRLSEQREGIIFLLWGRHAQQKEPLIDGMRHYILKAPHPSPLSAYRGFIGCGHFRQVNDLLLAQGKTPIDWRL